MSNLEKIRKTRRINKISAALLVSTLAFTAAAWGVSSFSSGEEYILQGASRSALVSAVQAENGVIIHEFKNIQAVSAKLTADQVQGVSSRNAMIRFINEDQQLSLSTDNRLESMSSNSKPHYSATNSKGVIWPTVAAEGKGVIWPTIAAEGKGVIWPTVAKEGKGVIWPTIAKEGKGVIWPTIAKEGKGVIWPTVAKQDKGVIWPTIA